MDPIPGSEDLVSASLITMRAPWGVVSLTVGLASVRTPPPRLAARFDPAAFEAILERRTVTAQAYVGLPLAEETEVMRGRVLTTLVRQIDAALHPDATIEDADPGTCIDGKLRGQHSAAYDWKRDGRRVACKSAQLAWHTSTGRWKLQFSGVNLGSEGVEAVFDELLLVAYTPRGLYVHRHDGRLGVSTHGKSTEATGHQIQIYGSCGEADWASALDDAVLPKLAEGGCIPLDSVPFDDPRMAAAQASHPPTGTAAAYEGVRLSDCSGSARGTILTAVARQIDAALHPDATIEDAERGTCIDGKQRGQHSAAYDWKRDGRRVACKSAQLAWHTSTGRWKLQFSGVNLGSEGVEAVFDELLLVAYTPRGLYVHRHDGRLGVSTHGKSTEATGRPIMVYGPRGEADWASALDDTVLPKLAEGGCECIAVVKW